MRTPTPPVTREGARAGVAAQTEVQGAEVQGAEIEGQIAVQIAIGISWVLSPMTI
jgi:hypothetical protein